MPAVDESSSGFTPRGPSDSFRTGPPRRERNRDRQFGRGNTVVDGTTHQLANHHELDSCM